MPILAYCVSMAYDFLDAPPTGVGQAEVYELEDLGLRAWYSEVEEDTFRGTENVTKAALEFHKFILAVFREGGVLPFKFPTILETSDELRSHLEEKAQWYSTALRKSEGLAQFEARVLSKIKLNPQAESGTEYLEVRRKLKEINDGLVAAVLNHVDDYLRGQHIKETQQGSRIYMLVERARSAAFRQQAGSLKVPDGFEVRLTGPWPPTDFLPEADHEP